MSQFNLSRIVHIGTSSLPVASILIPFAFWTYNRMVLGSLIKERMSPHGRLSFKFIVESLDEVRGGCS